MQLYSQPLNLHYDEETQELVVCYSQAPELDDPDPASFNSTYKVTVRIPNATREEV